MNNLKINNLGPVKSADINFGDLTFFVGPQATGKSIVLQMIKLIADKNHIRKTLEQYGYIWGKDTVNILNRYFGEDMAGIWNKSTEIKFDNTYFTKESLLNAKITFTKNSHETLFYVPAQRVVCLQNGWPRFFTDYEDSVPYVLRHFSETLRQMLESSQSKENGTIFPQRETLKTPLLDSINKNIFNNSKIIIDKTGKKRFKLNIANSSIPFMAWSAGQKEFMPLLLALYWLCPSSKVSKKDEIKYVIIEEPEMGLHPRAIETVLLQIIELLSRGYKVLVSTHSPVLLEFVWAFNYLKDKKGKEEHLYKLFELEKTAPVVRLFKDIFTTKDVKTYFFSREEENAIVVKDISSLDPGSEEAAISEWGGLSSFSSRASDIVSEIAANEE